MKQILNFDNNCFINTKTHYAIRDDYKTYHVKFYSLKAWTENEESYVTMNFKIQGTKEGYYAITFNSTMNRFLFGSRLYELDNLEELNTLRCMTELVS